MKKSSLVDAVVTGWLLVGSVVAAPQFYLEDLAIGLMRPVLTVDVER